MEQVKELKPSAFHIALWKYRGEKDSLIRYCRPHRLITLMCLSLPSTVSRPSQVFLPVKYSV